MNEQEKLQAISDAIKLRDNWKTLENTEALELIESLAKSGLFSIRQISQICERSSSSVSRLVRRDSRTGGKLNPKHLEMMRGLIFQNDLGQVDWDRVGRIVNGGTSPYVVAKITGIPRSTIHRKVSIGHLQ